MLVQIFGERCSGTNFLEDLLVANGHGVTVTDKYGHKHLFNRFKPRPVPDTGAVYIFIYRNPYDWLRSLNEKPHHTKYWDMPFSAFIRKRPWVCDVYHGKNFAHERGEIIEYYEGNVIDVRNDKNRTFDRLWLPMYSANVRYEDLRRDPEGTVRRVAALLNIPLKPGAFQNVMTTDKGERSYERKAYKPISQTDLDFINQSLDWGQEARIGYVPIRSAEGLDHILTSLYH